MSSSSPAFGGVQVDATGPEEAQGVPVDGVVGGADGDAAGGVEALDGVLDDGGGDDAEVDDIVSAGEQAGENAFADHVAAQTGSRPRTTGWPGSRKVPKAAANSST
jgi:hypothetical protein